MTRDDLADCTVTSDEEFQALLATVVEAAIDGGVDVRGAWECETRVTTHDWEILVTELARDVDAE